MRPLATKNSHVLIHEILEFAAAEAPESLALAAGELRLTFTELLQQVQRFAAGIVELTDLGDRVAVISENCPVLLTALYGIPAGGAIATLGNTRHSSRELIEMIHTTEPSLLLASGELLDRVASELPSCASLRAVICMDGAHPAASLQAAQKLGLSQVAENNRASAASEPVNSELPQQAEQSFPRLELQPSTPAWLIHTSGTTGTAKGALLSHRSLIAAIQNTALARPISDDDVYLFPFPLFHIAAYNVLHVHLRRRPVLLLPRFDAGEALRLIQSQRITMCSLAPTMLSMMLDHPDRPSTDLSSLRQISYGASAMPLDLLRRVLRELPDCGLAQGYGMTELSGNFTFLDPEGHRRAASTHPQLLASAGRPGPLVALRIADDDGREVPLGEAGEILVRGDQICEGYFRAEAATADSRHGPWFKTGDVGRIDEEGYLYIVDRKKDIIISGGENIASREVEDLLSTHPQVAQVAIIGLPDDHWGEVVCAVVVARPENTIDTDEFILWTKDKIAGYKRPRVVILLDELPVNASGKIDKAVLRSTLNART